MSDELTMQDDVSSRIENPNLAALEELGASVDLDDDGRISRIVLVGQHVSDRELKPFSRLGDSVRRINLIYSRLRGPGLGYFKNMRFLERLDLGANIELGDKGVAFLAPLKSLQMLRLWDTRIIDAGLVQLEGLTRLRWLYLSGTAISSTGLSSLKHLPLLRGIDLRATKIKDDGLKHLRDLQHLEWIDLSDTRIDGKGLTYLIDLPRLQRIHIRHTHIVPRHLDKFKKHHPDCQVDISGASTSY